MRRKFRESESEREKERWGDSKIDKKKGVCERDCEGEGR